MNKKGFTTPLVILTIILLLGVGVYIFVQSKSSEVVVPEKKPITQNSGQEITNETENMDLVEYENGLITNLKDVSGGKSTGTASILRKQNILIHNVSTDLPIPNGNNFYEGWLVDQSTNKFFSTGIMDNNVDSGYVLSFMSDDLSEGYNFVVITLETVKDETPEKHILEGLAQ